MSDTGGALVPPGSPTPTHGKRMPRARMIDWPCSELKRKKAHIHSKYTSQAGIPLRNTKILTV